MELELTNLARTPRQAFARITVRAADGDAVAFDATRSDGNERSVALEFTPSLPRLG